MTQLRKFLLSLFLSMCGFAAPAVADNYGTGQVFTMTNAASGNEILIFNHHPQQGLVGTGSVATGGDTARSDQPLLRVVVEYQDLIAACGVGHGKYLAGAIVAGHGWRGKSAHRQKQRQKEFSQLSHGIRPRTG